MDLDHEACYRAIALRDPRFDGQVFTGVKTTGIYCRPICPARTPLAKNVVFFPTAAAAQEAGFRPCLRCRPETAPDLGAWRGSSNTVSRALALIEDGALDEGDVERLAERLGVGGRQLRRLFRQHLGASPVAVAQTRRVHLAKQLIHETRLPMSEIAFAAGFGSIRRFNETFLALFGRPPKTLRRARLPDVSAGPRGEVTLLLRYKPPYEWPAMLEALAARAIPGIESVSDGAWRRSVEIDGGQGIVAVRPGEGHALKATIWFPRLTALPLIIARLRRVFDLAADPAAIAEHLARDALLAPIVAARPGLRLPGAWDGFEMAVRAILAPDAAARLVEAFGAPLDAPSGALTRVFPQAVAMAGVDLGRLGVSQRCAAALSSLAAAFAADPGILKAGHTPEDATAKLRASGIHQEMAHDIAQRAFRETDAFPSNADLRRLSYEIGASGPPHPVADAPALPNEGRGLSGNAAARLPTPLVGEGSRRRREGEGGFSHDLAARADSWRPWRAYAALHLAAPAGQSSSFRASSGSMIGTPSRIG